MVDVLTSKIETQDESLTLSNIMTDFQKLRDDFELKEYEMNKRLNKEHEDIHHIYAKAKSR